MSHSLPRRAASGSVEFGPNVRRGQRGDAKRLFRRARVRGCDSPKDAAMIEQYVDGQRVKQAQRSARSLNSVEVGGQPFHDAGAYVGPRTHMSTNC